MKLRSSVTFEGRRMAGARALWLANGMKREQMGKPVIAVVNSFTQFVPGHVHLHEAGQIVKEEIERLGYFAAEFNTIAIDDGIAMGHDGMLYSLPSREVIADSVEYMANAHKVDGMVCISNCDKITPGMLMAAMRLNIPAVFVSGGPMEAGVMGDRRLDLIDVMVESADAGTSDDQVDEMERLSCPTCGCCSGMFTANSMNCLTEAVGLALPGNGTIPATHEMRLELLKKAARTIVENVHKYYDLDDQSVLPRNIACRKALLNAMSLDIAMGGSTNTILHLLAIANEGKIDFSLDDIDSLSRKIPCICKVAPNTQKYHVEDVNRAGGVLAIMDELLKAGLVDGDVMRVDGMTLKDAIEAFKGDRIYLAAPSHVRTTRMGCGTALYSEMDTDRENGCIRDIGHAYTADGGLAVLRGNIAPDGCVVKTAGVDGSIWKFRGPAVIFDSQESAVEGILSGKVKSGDVVVIVYEGPRGGPGMQEMLYPTSYLKSMHLGKECALVTDGRFSGGTSGLSIGHVSPEAAAGGNIALLKDGDIIEIDITKRSIRALVSDNEFETRRSMEVKRGKLAFTPPFRHRGISASLRAYALTVSSADKGAVRLIEE